MATEDPFCPLQVLHLTSNMTLCGTLKESYVKLLNYMHTQKIKGTCLSDKAVFFYTRLLKKKQQTKKTRPQTENIKPHEIFL